MSSSLERTFLTRWQQLAPDAPAPQEQIVFHPTRQWKFDACWINALVYLELHGGGFVGGRHNREYGMVEDFQKYNAAVVMGWRGIYATTSMIENDPAEVIESIRTLLAQPAYAPDAELSMWTARVRSLRSGDCVEDNGIAVERLKSNTFYLSLSSGGFTVGGRDQALERVQQDVVGFILHGMSAAATPRILQNAERTMAQKSLF